MVVWEPPIPGNCKREGVQAECVWRRGPQDELNVMARWGTIRKGAPGGADQGSARPMAGKGRAKYGINDLWVVCAGNSFEDAASRASQTRASSSRGKPQSLKS